jgi:hypothetical protein
MAELGAADRGISARKARGRGVLDVHGHQLDTDSSVCPQLVSEVPARWARLGVHTPEFGVERDVTSIRRATRAMGIDFPVAVDSDYRVWRAFDNQYWPALYFADAEGLIRHHRFGEGEYEHSELSSRLYSRPPASTT